MQQEHQQEPSFGLDTGVFLTILEKGDAAHRLELAQQLALFLARKDGSAVERQQVWPVVLKLATDMDWEVRRALADGLSQVADLDADVLFSIVSDDDEIALPFLFATPALDHWHMLAVLRVGDEQRQASVALRPDISPQAVDYVVDVLPLSVNLLLFENPAAALTPSHYGKLYERFGNEPQMLDCLLARPDLPLEIRITQTRRAANRVHQLMAERGWLPANDASELVSDAEEITLFRILTQSEEEGLPSIVAFLVGRDLLTPSILLRAACQGEMAVVEHALAHLADISPRRARALMSGSALGGFRSLHSKAGLPQSCFWVLQAACDVAAEERAESIRLNADDFGRRVIEALMTRYETLPARDRPRHLDYVGRFAADRPRLIAKRLKADLLRAA